MILGSDGGMKDNGDDAVSAGPQSAGSQSPASLSAGTVSDDGGVMVRVSGSVAIVTAPTVMVAGGGGGAPSSPHARVAAASAAETSRPRIARSYARRGRRWGDAARRRIGVATGVAFAIHTPR